MSSLESGKVRAGRGRVYVVDGKRCREEPGKYYYICGVARRGSGGIYDERFETEV